MEISSRNSENIPSENPRKGVKKRIVDMKFDVSTTKVFRKAVYILYDGNTYNNLRKEASIALIRHIPVMQCKMTPKQRAELDDKLTAEERDMIRRADEELGD